MIYIVISLFMLLSGKNISHDLQDQLAQKVKTVFAGRKPYVAILYFGDNASSATYVRNKKAYGLEIGLPVIVFGQSQNPLYDRNQVSRYDDLDIYINQTYDSIGKVMELITYLNHDDECVGILVQLPLPEQFASYKTEILAAITPNKDIDGLGGVVTGLSSIDLIDFIPATPRAVLMLLDYYKLGDMQGKMVAIIGQSTVVGKPLIFECIKRGATVTSFNENNSLEEIQSVCKQSDYIISCTGKIHLVDEHFVRDDQTQILVDVGYGHLDGKPVGDIEISKIADRVASYTPVPGGVGPLTVACIFSNVLDLQANKEILKPYKL